MRVQIPKIVKLKFDSITKIILKNNFHRFENTQLKFKHARIEMSNSWYETFRLNLLFREFIIYIIYDFDSGLIDYICYNDKLYHGFNIEKTSEYNYLKLILKINKYIKLFIQPHINKYVRKNAYVKL